MPEGGGAGRWRQFLQLAPSDRRVLVAAAALLPLLALALRAFGLQRVYSVLAAGRPRGRSAGVFADVECARIARLVETAGRYAAGRPKCLPRSLALWWFLRRAGIESQLCVGVRKEAGVLEAHAWVERAGCVLNDASDVSQRFLPFDSARFPVQRFAG